MNLSGREEVCFALRCLRAAPTATGNLTRTCTDPVSHNAVFRENALNKLAESRERAGMPRRASFDRLRIGLKGLHKPG